MRLGNINDLRTKVEASEAHTREIALLVGCVGSGTGLLMYVSVLGIFTAVIGFAKPKSDRTRMKCGALSPVGERPITPENKSFVKRN